MISARKSICWVSPEHLFFVLSVYACTASTGPRFLFSGNLAKKKSVSGLPCLDCFAKAIEAKVTPSGEYLQCTLLSFAKSADLDGLVRVNRATVIRVRSLIERVTFLPIELMCAVTLATSHVSAYLGWGGGSLVEGPLNQTCDKRVLANYMSINFFMY